MLVNIRLGEYSPIFTESEANNCSSIITQVIIREKQEPSEKCRFCLSVSNCHASMNRDAQFADHMLNQNHMLKINDKLYMPQAECQYSLTATSLRRSIDFCE